MPLKVARLAASLASRVVPDDPFAELPSEITMTREEAAVVLFELDVLEAADVDPAEAGR